MFPTTTNPTAAKETGTCWRITLAGEPRSATSGKAAILRWPAQPRSPESRTGVSRVLLFQGLRILIGLFSRGVKPHLRAALGRATDRLIPDEAEAARRRQPSHLPASRQCASHPRRYRQS